MNTVILSGKVGRDCSVKQTSGGTNFLRFPLATSRKVKENWETDWHDVTVWGKGAKPVRKGEDVLVTGQYIQRKYQTKDGENRVVHEVAAFDFYVKPKEEKSESYGADYGSPEQEEMNSLYD